ncbi:MAG: tellurite resistance TerB family protein, partial [Acidobacteriota bacterium]|nr:tellurite resistance TerB family protein [Acidobacteriota bacterium]
AASAMPADVLRIVRLAVSAARADGVLAPAERALIVQRAQNAGVEAEAARELDYPRPLSEIVADVTDEEARRDLYRLAFTIVRADESVTGAERIYLAQLAHQLGLDAGAAARLESETAAQIDAAEPARQS